MQSLILVGGKGSRMGSTTKSKPKSLVPINGKPLLEKQLNILKKFRFENIYLITGYLSSAFDYLNIPSIFNNEWANTNMVNGLMKADKLLSNDTTIVSYGDIFYEENILNSLYNCKYDFCLAYDINWESLWRKRFINPLVDAETFKISNDGFITEIGATPKDCESIQGQYMGIFKITPNAWKKLKYIYHELSIDKQNTISMTEIISIYIDKNMNQVFGVPNYEEWGEIDTNDDLKLYER